MTNAVMVTNHIASSNKEANSIHLQL